MKKSFGKNCEEELIHLIVERNSLLYPDECAVICGSEEITYKELDYKANCVAKYLQSEGVEENSFVGIYMQRSIETIISILAILKMGCTYVPIDIIYPKERTEYIIRDANVKTILTQTLYVSVLEEVLTNEKKKIINIKKALAQKCMTFESYSDKRDNKIACVVYSSGTLGKPKGVVVTHNNFVSYVKALSARLEISYRDTYLHTASVAFSSSNRQIWLTLCNVGCLVMTTEEEKKDLYLLLSSIIKNKVTIIDFVPSLMRKCIDALKVYKSKNKDFFADNCLRLILSASEALPSDIPITVSEILSKRLGTELRYVNMYGLTETTGIVSTYEIVEDSICNKDEGFIIPIGKPLDGVEILILDEDMSLVDKETSGMLYICSDQVSPRYLNDDSITSKVMLKSDVFSKKECFRTGDICRLNRMGILEYVGRIDDQIKINGIRIEPLEIEVILRTHEKVKDVAVALRYISGNPKLVAYIVLFDKSDDIGEIRDYAKMRLPSYMNPSHYILISSLPLSTNGKLDRKLLPDNEHIFQNTENDCEEPRGPLENIVADIWKRILGISKVGREQKFLSIGGSSIQFIQMQTMIYQETGCNVSVAKLFSCATVALIAKVIQQQKDDSKQKIKNQEN